MYVSVAVAVAVINPALSTVRFLSSGAIVYVGFLKLSNIVFKSNVAGDVAISNFIGPLKPILRAKTAPAGVGEGVGAGAGTSASAPEPSSLTLSFNIDIGLVIRGLDLVLPTIEALISAA